jgi:aminomethyltransferase
VTETSPLNALRVADEGQHPGWRGTPFVSRTAPLNRNQLWMHWDGLMVADVYSDVETELRAIRTSAAMGDMSPLAKYEVRGRGAEAMLDRMIPRDVTRLAPGSVLYSPWCDEEGRLVNDGLVIREADAVFRLSADPNGAWLARCAEGFDVEIVDITRELAILTLQGPQAPAVLAAATGTDWRDLPFSRTRDATIAGCAVDVLRQGFTGEVGYELWVRADDAPAVWDAVAAAGADAGVVPAGAHALDLARIEAGLLIIGYDYTGAGPDRHGATVEPGGAYHATPLELDMVRLIDFDKPDFLGREALVTEAQGGSRRRLAGLVCDWRALVAAHQDRGVPPAGLDRVHWYPKALRADGRDVGHVTSLTWAPTVERLIGFAHVEPSLAEPGTRLTVVWEVAGEPVEVPAVIGPVSQLRHRRATALA